MVVNPHHRCCYFIRIIVVFGSVCTGSYTIYLYFILVMKILGISAFYHDSAAALLEDGCIIAAIQEERLSRKKHDSSFPKLAIQKCLDLRGLKISDIDAIAFYEKPFLKFDRILLGHFREWPKAFGQFWGMQTHWFQSKLKIPSIIKKETGFKGPILFSQHHESHAASAYYASPFDRACIVTADGVGEWATAGIHFAEKNKFKTLREMHYPHSWGLYYSAFTDYLGFEINDGEYKVMGMAPYGKPAYVEKILNSMVHVGEHGLIELDRKYFRFHNSEHMLNFDRVESLLGIKRRTKKEKLEQQHFDLAASVQQILEDGIKEMVKYAVSLTGCKNVCMAGGVALNCRANSKILELPEVDDLYVFPAAGDAGGSVGAAYWAYHQIINQPRKEKSFSTVYLGPQFSNTEIRNFLNRNKYPHEELSNEDLTKKTADLLFNQKIVGWFQGAMEFGPRALGNRSILGDPRFKENWNRINHKVKFREDFRPLAPSILSERTKDFFEFDRQSPYMILTAQNKTDKLPAVTHLDGSSRIQTIQKNDNPLYYDLITEFEKLSGVPVLINTSFNTSGMPIVCTPQNAFQAFAESDLDYLVLGNYLLNRQDFPYLVKNAE